MTPRSVVQFFRLTVGGVLWNTLRFIGSLQVAVVVLGACAAVLALATLLEWRWGTEVAHFVVYRAWWFHVLVVLLACSVLFSAIVRFPWKRHHTGFLITHSGILLILAGALISLWYGVDAQLPVFEGESAHTAFANEAQFVLMVLDWAGWGERKPAASGIAGPVDAGTGTAELLPRPLAAVPFRPGPFHWGDYRRWPISLFRIVPRTQGVLYDKDGVRLEVVDYYRDAVVAEAPPLRLAVRVRGEEWKTIDCRVRGIADPHVPRRAFGLGSRQELETGQRIVFWVATSRAETEAFRKALPAQPLDPSGEVVLLHHDHILRVSLRELQERQQVPFTEAGLSVKFHQFNPRFLGLVLDLEPMRPGGGDGIIRPRSPHRIFLFADMVEFNRYDETLGVYGSLWYYAAETKGDGSEQSQAETSGDVKEAEPSADGRAVTIFKPLQPRVDILQGTDGVLYYRSWLRGAVRDVGVLPGDGSAVRIFAGEPEELELRVEQFRPMDRPGEVIEPQTVDASRRRFARPFARVRMTVDGMAEEFWLEEQPVSPFAPEEREQEYRRWVVGRRRSVAVELVPRSFELGFAVRLHEFERKLEPGSTHPASYGSRVDIVDRENPGRLLFRDVWITMNRPLTVRDPKQGYVYRIYQEAYRGPFRPGDPLFEHVVRGRQPREQLYLSWLTLNYDPGRGLKYFGSFLTVIGIAITFYMRGYLRGPKPGEQAVAHVPVEALRTS